MKKVIMMLPLAAMLSAPAAALAAGQYNDVVIDKRSNLVRDMRGNCVYTKWLVNQDNCGDRAGPASFLVFFDFDKAFLTPEAKNIIRAAADAIKKDKATKVKLVGHADRSGSAQYNKALSNRRASAVKQMLVKLGIKSKMITTAAKGESQPLVPTADGVREPQNRRVEILYGK